MNGKNIQGKDVLVELARNEIVYDVSFWSWAQDDKVMLSDKMADFIDRQVKSATAVLQSKISFARIDRTQMQTDNIREHQDSWDIVLRLPDGWRGSAELLTDLVHQYVSGFIVLAWIRSKAKSREERMVVADKQQEVDGALLNVISEAYKMDVECPSWSLGK